MFVFQRMRTCLTVLCCAGAICVLPQISHAQMSDEDVQKIVAEQQTFFKQVLQETTDQIKVDEDYEDSYGRPVANMGAPTPSSVGTVTGSSSGRSLPVNSHAYIDGKDAGQGDASGGSQLVYKNGNGTSAGDPLAGVPLPQRVFNNVEPNRF